MTEQYRVKGMGRQTNVSSKMYKTRRGGGGRARICLEVGEKSVNLAGVILISCFGPESSACRRRRYKPVRTRTEFGVLIFIRSETASFFFLSNPVSTDPRVRRGGIWILNRKCNYHFDGGKVHRGNKIKKTFEHSLVLIAPKRKRYSLLRIGYTTTMHSV